MHLPATMTSSLRSPGNHQNTGRARRPASAPRLTQPSKYPRLRRKATRLAIGDPETDAVSIRQGRQQVLLTGHNLRRGIEQLKARRTKTIRKYASAKVLDHFISKCAKNDGRLDDVGRLADPLLNHNLKLQKQLADLMAYDLISEDSRVHFSLAGRQKLLTVPRGNEDKILHANSEMRLQEWTEDTEKDFQTFKLSLRHKNSLRTRNILNAYLQHYHYAKMKEKMQIKKKNFDKEWKTGDGKKFSSGRSPKHLQSNNNSRFGLVMSKKHEGINNQRDILKMTMASKTKASTAKEDIARALINEPGMNEWLVKKSYFVESMVQAQRLRMIRVTQKQARLWLRKRHAAATKIQYIIRKFMKQLHELLRRRREEHARLERKKRRNLRYKAKKTNHYKEYYTATVIKDRYNEQILNARLTDSEFSSLESHVAEAVCNDNSEYLKKVTVMRTSFLRAYIQKQSKSIFHRANEAEKRRNLRKRIAEFKDANKISIKRLADLEEDGWDYRTALRSMHQKYDSEEAQITTRSIQQNQTQSTNKNSRGGDDQMKEHQRPKSSGFKVTATGNLPEAQVTRAISRLDLLQRYYRSGVQDGENENTRHLKDIAEMEKKEEWAAQILQKVIRGHSERLFISALKWSSMGANQIKIYRYFDVNRDGDLSRGEIGNLVHQLLSQRFDPYTKHAHMLKGSFTVARFEKWWRKARWEVCGIKNKLRFVSLIKSLKAFDIASQKAATAMQRLSQGEIGGTCVPRMQNSAGVKHQNDSNCNGTDVALPENFPHEPMMNNFAAVLNNLKKLLKTDRSTLFLVNYTDKTLWSAIVSEEERNLKIRIPWNLGIVGYVRESKMCLNVEDAYKCRYFNPKIDRETGYRTKSILCGVIRHPKNKRVVGVVQLINKFDKQRFITSFTKSDEGMFIRFLRRLEDALHGTIPPGVHK